MPVFEGDAARGAARASFSSNYDLINDDANRLMNEGSEEAQASLNLLTVSTTSSVEEREADDVELYNAIFPNTWTSEDFYALMASARKDLMVDKEYDDNARHLYDSPLDIEGSEHACRLISQKIQELPAPLSSDLRRLMRKFGYDDKHAAFIMKGQN